jgi:hypothetical protein
MKFVPHRKQASMACYGDSFTFYYVYYVRTSQETQASLACYADSFTFLYVNYVRTSQEIRLWPPRPVKGIASLLIYRWSSYLTENKPLWPVRGYLYLFICGWSSYLTGNTGLLGLLGDIFIFLYVDDVRTSQEIHLRPPRPVKGIALLFSMCIIFVPHRKHTCGLHGLLRR